MDFVEPFQRQPGVTGISFLLQTTSQNGVKPIPCQTWKQSLLLEYLSMSSSADTGCQNSYILTKAGISTPALSEKCATTGDHHNLDHPIPSPIGWVGRTAESHSSHHAYSLAAKDDQCNWDLHLPKIMLACRSSVQESTWTTPASLIFGRELRLPIDMMFPLPDEPPTTSD